MVDEASQPARSWELDVADLHKLDAAAWQDLKMSMFSKILLVDPHRKQRHIVQIPAAKDLPTSPRAQQDLCIYSG